MLALTLAAPRRFEFIEQDEPTPPGAHEALVRVLAVGVCGTDEAGYLGKMPLIQCPRILGHELGVEVLAVGGDVAHVRPGDRCTVEPYLNCGACLSCRRGRTNCCERLHVLGVHGDGGLRPRLTVPAAKLHPSNALSFEELALVEPLAIGCHAVERSGLRVDESVLVLGAGPIGLGVIVSARLCGARVEVVEPDRCRREFVRSHGGVERVHEAPESAAPADVVFDATGQAASMGRAPEFAAFGGRVVFVGLTAEPLVLDDHLLHRRELTLLASRNAVTGDFRRLLAHMEKGRIQVGPWITHRIPFAAVPTEFPRLVQAAGGKIKAVIVPPFEAPPPPTLAP